MDEDVREHLESLHRSINLLSGNVDFLLKMMGPTLLIVARVAYVLERVSNRTFDLPEGEGEPSIPQIEEAFSEIKKQLNEQLRIMRTEGVRRDG